MTAKHYECAAAVQLEWVECMSSRLEAQWHQIRKTWYCHNLTTNKTAVLLKIAEMVKKTGVTVEEILHISRQFVKDHCIVEPLIGEPVVTGSNEYSDLNSTMGT